MKFCNNCSLKNNCFYRGIINPCTDWRKDSKIRLLNRKAEGVVDMPMSFEEHRFVDSCISTETFSVKQESWLLSIIRKVERCSN